MWKKKEKKVYLKKEKKPLNAMQFKETVYNSYDTVRNDKNNTIQQPFDTLQYGTIRCDKARYRGTLRTIR